MVLIPPTLPHLPPPVAAELRPAPAPVQPPAGLVLPDDALAVVPAALRGPPGVALRPTPRALVPNDRVHGVLAPGQLSSPQGRWTGGALLIHDNPESYDRAGVLGSTIGVVPGRGDGRHVFTGEARLFALANNRTGRTQRVSVVVRNEGGAPLSLTLRGVLYVKGVTPTDGTVPVEYARDGGFRGPHAIAALSFLEAAPGKNGYVTKSLSLGPGAVAVVQDATSWPGSEAFVLLDLRAREAAGRFSVATLATPERPTADQLARLAAGSLPAASGGYAPASPDAAGRPRMGRPNGVFLPGSRFVGGRSVTLAPGLRTGDLVFPTRFRRAAPEDLGSLSAVLENPAPVGAASRCPDGHYGLTYDLSYALENPTDHALRVAVLLTSPQTGPSDVHHPVGGELTMPVRVDGRAVRARVDQRGEGRVLAVVEVPARGRRRLEVELTNLGNTFPPAGIELRADRP